MQAGFYVIPFALLYIFARFSNQTLAYNGLKMWYSWITERRKINLI